MGSAIDTITVGVDIGGTFTDIVLEVPEEPAVTVKRPTTSQPSDGVIEGIITVCDRADIDPAEIDSFRHGTTIATNAILEREGATTALITTEGFRDVIEIGRQDRTHLYDLGGDRPPPLVPREYRLTIAERTPPPDHPNPEAIRTPPTPGEIESIGSALQTTPVEAVAISLLHADIDDEHERLVQSHLTDALDVPVVTSSEIMPEFREFERTATTVASAYLTPVMHRYLTRLDERCDRIGIPTPWLMQSNGGIATAEHIAAHAVKGILSGPAAGVVGGYRATRDLALDGHRGVITLDMGGTSADVCLVHEGEPVRTTETTVGGIPIHTPTIDIHTVGAGGGSIAWVDTGGALRVGPESAGAKPGPACYDRGGTRPTVTDAAVVLEIIGDRQPLGNGLHLDRSQAVEVMSELAERADLDSATEAAAGVHRVATATMTQAVRHSTVERGHDPRAYALVGFGGAGGMFACSLADRLDIETVVLPRRTGVLSADGLHSADERHDETASVHRRLDDAAQTHLDATFEELERQAKAVSTTPDRVELNRYADLRYVGQSYELRVPVDRQLDVAGLRSRFMAQHERRRGYRLDEPIDVITCRVHGVIQSPPRRRDADDSVTGRSGQRSVHIPGVGATTHTIYPGVPDSPTAIDAPCIIEQPHSTLHIPPGWQVDSVHPELTVHLEGRS